jgi:hypothetical protein
MRLYLLVLQWSAGCSQAGVAELVQRESNSSHTGRIGREFPEIFSGLFLDR